MRKSITNINNRKKNNKNLARTKESLYLCIVIKKHKFNNKKVRHTVTTVEHYGYFNIKRAIGFR